MKRFLYYCTTILLLSGMYIIGLGSSQSFALDTESVGTAPCNNLCQSHAKNSIKKNELELNWNLMTGSASYSKNDNEFPLESGGLMLELNPSVNVTTAPGLNIGMVVGFFFLSSTGEFSTDEDGPPATTYNYSITAISAGSYILAKYSYDIDFSVLKLTLENGYGLGYFINTADEDWVDVNNDSNSGNSSDDELGWSPMVKAGIKISLPVTDISSLGLNVNANFMPLAAGNYSSFLNTGIGLNYEVDF